MAINSSLLETSIDGARGILLNISGGSDLSLYEVNEVAEIINSAADPEANIIFGAVVDENLGDTIWVTVVAAGFDATSEEPAEDESAAGRQAADPAASAPDQAAQPAPQAARPAPSAGVLSREDAREFTKGVVDAAPAPARPREDEPRRQDEGRGKGDDGDLEVPSFLK
jgi:cell division protein FtsZ